MVDIKHDRVYTCLTKFPKVTYSYRVFNLSMCYIWKFYWNFSVTLLNESLVFIWKFHSIICKVDLGWKEVLQNCFIFDENIHSKLNSNFLTLIRFMMVQYFFKLWWANCLTSREVNFGYLVFSFNKKHIKYISLTQVVWKSL